MDVNKLLFFKSSLRILTTNTILKLHMLELFIYHSVNSLLKVVLDISQNIVHFSPLEVPLEVILSVTFVDEFVYQSFLE